ncbi:MAG: hypothetical protein WA777_13235 [Rhodanobacter sp.]
MVIATEVRDFISSYTTDQRSRIAFQWNGKHSAELEDLNLKFREAVIDAIANQEEPAPTTLLSDIFEEETSFSVEAWGARDELSVLASQLLSKGGTDSVLTFVRCKWKSFDTEMACAGIDLSEPLRQKLHQFCQSQAGIAGPNQPQYELGAKYFGGLAKRGP